MKKAILTISRLSILFCLICIAPNVEAQSFLDKAKKKAQKAAEKKANDLLNGNSNNDNTSESSKGSGISNTTRSIANGEVPNPNAAKQEEMSKKAQGMYYCDRYIAGEISTDFLDYEDYEGYSMETFNYYMNYPNKMDDFYKSEVKRRVEYHNACLAKLASDDVKNGFYEQMDDYYKQNSSNDMEYLLKVQEALTYVKENMLPNNSDLDELLNYANKLTSKIRTAATAKLDGLNASDFHKANVNTILFTSNMDLDPMKATAADFKESFTAGEFIKGIAFLDDSYVNLYGKYGKPSYIFVEDQRDYEVYEQKESEKKFPYIEFIMVTDGDHYEPGDEAGVVHHQMEWLSKLPPRQKTFTIRIAELNDGKPVYGKLKFDASNDAGMEKIAKMAKSVKAKGLGANGIPVAKMRNASVEKSCIDLFNAAGWDEKFTKCIIASPSYIQLRHRVTGTVVGRSLKVFMVSKKPDGTCMYQDFNVAQEKVGGGYGPWMRRSTGSQVEVECGKL